MKFYSDRLLQIIILLTYQVEKVKYRFLNKLNSMGDRLFGSLCESVHNRDETIY
jgi:hypothetical protein